MSCALLDATQSEIPARTGVVSPITRLNLYRHGNVFPCSNQSVQLRSKSVEPEQ